jgi:hypothetical protein
MGKSNHSLYNAKKQPKRGKANSLFPIELEITHQTVFSTTERRPACNSALLSLTGCEFTQRPERAVSPSGSK